MANLIHSARHAFPSMCEGQAKVYLERTIAGLFGRSLGYSKLWTRVEGERYFDVYQVRDPGSSRCEQFFFDVSAFFEKPDRCCASDALDLPEANRHLCLGSLFSDDELGAIAVSGGPEARRSLHDYSVTFKQFSSEQVGQRIATVSHRTRAFEVSPVRTYVNQSIPFLHGHRFYKLFILHQVAHGLQGHDPRLTELGPRRDGRLPRPGVDCIAFTPLAPYDFARDFLNFMFWSHQPDAFDSRDEVEAFAETARYGVRMELFTPEELRSGLREARLRSRLKDLLSVEIALLGPAPAARPDPTIRMQAH